MVSAPALELTRTHEHRCRRAVLGDDHLLVGGIEVIDERSERQLLLGQGGGWDLKAVKIDSAT